MKSTVEQAAPLLKLIRQAEARGSYNAIWGGIKKVDYPAQMLTEMTVGQVLDWQDSIDHKYMSEASGAYQFLEDTLREIYAAAGVSRHDLFNPVTQDKLAVHLLKRRGLTKYLRGEIPLEVFGNELAKEWASLPVMSGKKRGKSYYGGDGLNKVGVSVDEMREVLQRVGAETDPITTPQPKQPVNPFVALIGGIIAALAALAKYLGG